MTSGKRTSSQLEFPLLQTPEPDRNHKKGGRSFYFFDLDDNVFFLTTPIFLFHKQTNEELPVSTGQFAQIHQTVGTEGAYKDYKIDFNDETGSFRRFRGVKPLLEDLKIALEKPDFHWKGPSWNFFHYAVFNRRPVSLITARGHSPHAVETGLELLCKSGFLPQNPNYLSVFPVGNPETRKKLGDLELKLSTPELKRRAIVESIRAAFQTYGRNPYHRFGMSDDDPKNLEMIVDAMREMKTEHPDNSFFVISSAQEPILKQEIFLDHLEKTELRREQLSLF